MNSYELYTDGSCSGNPGPGGWGAIVIDGTRKAFFSGGAASTTNNRMEVLAAIEGLSHIPVGGQVTLYSDSTYLVNTMTRKWKRNKNNDLWVRLDNLVRGLTVRWEWVRGHSGHSLNEEVDRIAVAAMGHFKSKRSSVLSIGGSSDTGDPEVQNDGGTGIDKMDRQNHLTHVDDEGSARMVDVGEKSESLRVATATCTITMNRSTLELINTGRVKKGDVFTVARLAGINAAKHTWELIPLAHQVPLSHVEIDFDIGQDVAEVVVTSSARTTARTGVEMEALIASSVAALTIYDMCKAVDRGMSISAMRLLEKRGGVHGDYSYAVD